MALIPAEYAGGGAKFSGSVTVTSTSSKTITLPAYSFLATMNIGSKSYPTLLAPNSSGTAVNVYGYFNRETGAYTQLAAETSYTLWYYYFEND